MYVVKLDNGAATYHKRVFDLGPGIPGGASTLGQSILLPGSGVIPGAGSGANNAPCKGKLCSITTKIIHRLYWREPGVDDL